MLGSHGSGASLLWRRADNRVNRIYASVEAGVVQPPIKDGSSVACRVEFQLMSCVAQFGQRVRIVTGL